jgi:hypothetical protein
MKNKKDERLFSFGIVLVICSSCVIAPYHTTFYRNLELSVWTDAHGSWSLDDEKWLMRGYDHSNRMDKVIPNKIRNNEQIYN